MARSAWVVRLSLVFALALVTTTAWCQETTADEAGQQARLKALQDQGAKATMTIFPIAVGDRVIPDVGGVVGMMLERAGMRSIEASETEFRPTEDTGFDQMAGPFGEFVRQQELTTDYAVYGEFVGKPKTGVEEVCGIIVDKEGRLVWVDRQLPDDPDFKRINPRNPMTCCMLLTERVRTMMGLPDPFGKNAKTDGGGKITRNWMKRTGVPDKAELAAIEERAEKFENAESTAKLVIFPVRLGKEVDRDGAANLAKLINEAGLLKAEVAKEQPNFDVARAMNEQKVLWSMAYQFRDYVRAEHPDADYTMYADYMLHPHGKEAGAVHFVICDRAGDWVVVDFQNSHQADFKSLEPKIRADCDRLVVKRLTGYLR